MQWQRSDAVWQSIFVECSARFNGPFSSKPLHMHTPLVLLPAATIFGGYRPTRRTLSAPILVHNLSFVDSVLSICSMGPKKQQKPIPWHNANVFRSAEAHWVVHRQLPRRYLSLKKGPLRCRNPHHVKHICT